MRVDHKELDCKDDLKLRKFDVPKVKLSLLVWNKKMFNPFQFISIMAYEAPN